MVQNLPNLAQVASKCHFISHSADARWNLPPILKCFSEIVSARDKLPINHGYHFPRKRMFNAYICKLTHGCCGSSCMFCIFCICSSYAGYNHTCSCFCYNVVIFIFSCLDPGRPYTVLWGRPDSLHDCRSLGSGIGGRWGMGGRMSTMRYNITSLWHFDAVIYWCMYIY